jgi:hypothetical protein
VRSGGAKPSGVMVSQGVVSVVGAAAAGVGGSETGGSTTTGTSGSESEADGGGKSLLAADDEPPDSGDGAKGSSLKSAGQTFYEVVIVKGGQVASKVGDLLVLKYEIESAAGAGLVQGAANTINGVQDGLVGISNIPSLAWNYTVGWLPGVSQARYAVSPDWAKDLVTREDPTLHGVSKFLGGTGVLLLAPSPKVPLPAGASVVSVHAVAQTANGTLVPLAGRIVIAEAQTVTVAAPAAAVVGSTANLMVTAGPPGGASGPIGSPINPASASRPTKPGSPVSEAAASLDSHATRPGWPGPKPSGNAAAKNAQAQALVDDIISDPARDVWTGAHPRPEWGGTVTEVYRPDGLGVRFDVNGQFVGFITRPPS